MPILPNARHEQFAQAIAAGTTADAAYKHAGFKPSRAHASRLAAKGNIRARIAELQAEVAERVIEKVALTEADFLTRLIREADFMGEGSSHGARVQAVKIIGEHLGLLKQRMEHEATGTLGQLLREISREGSAAPIATARKENDQ